MNSIQSRLRAGDPASREPQMSGADAARIRESILAARPATSRFGATVPVAIALLGAAGGSVWVVQSTPPAEVRQIEPPRQRQLQFSTPGGTRVIWFFNPDFEVR